MTDHAATLATFLRTDLYRLQTTLDEQMWEGAVATRLKEHLHRVAHLLALVTQAPAAPLPSLDTLDEALDTLETLTTELLTAITALTPQALDAPVLDAHERGLTLIGHLYDYARLSATLVEWSAHLPPAPTLEDWWEE
jgi:hypothetical protein